MKYNPLTLVIYLLVFYTFGYIYGQEAKKELQINKINIPPKIDGELNDKAWENANIASNFSQFRPQIGIKANDSIKTIVKMAYDDKAIYVSAYLYDNPDTMMSQLTNRDNFGQSDFFSVILNPNNDAQNDTGFFVFSSGVQADAISSPTNGEDFSWNAVWESAVKIQSDGWSLEMRIPYRCLRFSNENLQVWGVNFHRRFRHNQAQYAWNPIDPTQGYIGLYSGVLKGIKNINPPLRLNLYPFVSHVSEFNKQEINPQFNYGLDIKYGITENFTLDFTLIPDFSQAGFDNLSLNLGPFEQTFSEQRQIFTEGIDLLNKGGLFFSRRIGSKPTGPLLEENEAVISTDTKVDVNNVLKITGRSKKGLGVGVLNAITNKSESRVVNNLTNDTITKTSEPIANYNVLVFDQQFNKNSSVSLINTNVVREGGFRDSNVSALIFNINNKRNTYRVSGGVKASFVNDIDENKNGIRTDFFIGKTHGNWRYSFDHRYADKKYDINDLGLMLRNNFNEFGADYSYRIFKPTKSLNTYSINGWFNYRRLASPNTYTGSNFGLRYSAISKKLMAFGGVVNFAPGKQYNYFEPRKEGSFFISENFLNTNAFISTNYNKPFAIDVNIGGRVFFEKNRKTTTYRFGISPRYRFNDHFNVNYSFNYELSKFGRGFAAFFEDESIFGERDFLNISNRFSFNYTFNPLMSAALVFRYSVDKVTYNNLFFNLLPNGRLLENPTLNTNTFDKDPNQNFAFWNIDLNYSWQLAPGSFLTCLYRNRILLSNDDVSKSYTKTLSSLFDEINNNTFSIKLQYFLDFSGVKSIFNKKREDEQTAFLDRIQDKTINI